MYVATNRQKKNAFEKRAEMQRKAAEPAPKAAPRATPTPVAEPKPDLEAMKAAAAEAAALVHASASADIAEQLRGKGTLEVPESMLVEGIEDHAETLYDALSGVVADPEVAADAVPEPKRGRPMSAAVAKRNATILQLLAENPEGLSKPQLATELQEKEANVYTSLRRLQSDGKVRMENTEGTKYLWYLV
jgi:hypothetical protein